MTYSLTTVQATSQAPSGFTHYGEAVEAAKTFALASGVEVTVKHDETGASVFATSPAAIRVAAEGGIFQPWTRIEVPKHFAPALDGWITDYQRKRIQATVYRSETPRDLPWLIHDGRTGGSVQVKNCKAANEITKAMRHGRML